MFITKIKGLGPYSQKQKQLAEERDTKANTEGNEQKENVDK